MSEAGRGPRQRLVGAGGWPVYLTALALAYCLAAVAIGEATASSTHGMLPLPARFAVCAALPAGALVTAYRRLRPAQAVFTVLFVPVGLILWPLIPALVLALFGLVAAFSGDGPE